LRKTFELVAETGPAPDDFDGLFSRLAVDPEDALDGVRDLANMPSDSEPPQVLEDLSAVRARQRVSLS
jgi:hypothetical protein